MKQGWIYKKLNEVCDKGSSNIVINKLEDNNGDYPLFGASGLVKNVDFYHQDKPYIGIVKDGAGVGRVNTYPAFSSLVGTMQYIFAKDNCLLDYIKYFLIKLDLSHCVSGATIPHIYFKDYGKERIPVPSIDVQQSIVDELNKINELIELKKSQMSDLESLAYSVFYEMFGDLNNTSFTVQTLNETCEFIKDGTHQTPTYTDDKVKGVKFLSAKDVVSGYINWLNIKYIPYELHTELYKRIAPKRGDILLCKNGTTGICAIVETDEIFDIYVSLALLRPKENCLPEYLHYAINNPYTKRQFDDSLKGIGVPNLHLGEIKKTKIIFPPMALQQTFAEKINVIERQKKHISSSIQDLETLLASRMQYWFD